VQGVEKETGWKFGFESEVNGVEEDN